MLKVLYEKAHHGYWFYYSIGNLDYAVVYRNKTEFLKAKNLDKNHVKFIKLKEVE